MTDEFSIDFTLDDADRRNPLWVRLEAYMGLKLGELRARNDDPKLTAEATASLRGHIACLKGLIALGIEPPRDGSTPTTHGSAGRT